MSANSSQIAAFHALNDFNKIYPETKAIYRGMQKWQLKNDHDKGIFCPSSQIWQLSPMLINRLASEALELKFGGAGAVTPLAKDYHSMSSDETNLLQHFWGCHLFGAWRNTLSVYSLDQEFATSIAQTPIPDDTPSLIFNRLPEWCVYIEIPEGLNIDVTNSKKSKQSSRLLGFWALFDYKVFDKTKTHEKSLNIVPHFNQKIGVAYECFQPIQVIIDDKLTIKEACFKSFSHMPQSDPLILNAMMQTDYKMVNLLLSFLLCLCAEEPDVSNQLNQSVSEDYLRSFKHTIHKKTGAFIPPNSPTIYHVGKRLGAQVRDVEYKNAQANKAASDSDKPHIIVRKRPHIRRGHWHSVWHGPADNRKHRLYWQPPIFVNAKI